MAHRTMLQKNVRKLFSAKMRERSMAGENIHYFKKFPKRLFSLFIISFIFFILFCLFSFLNYLFPFPSFSSFSSDFILIYLHRFVFFVLSSFSFCSRHSANLKVCTFSLLEASTSFFLRNSVLQFK